MDNPMIDTLLHVRIPVFTISIAEIISNGGNPDRVTEYIDWLMESDVYDDFTVAFRDIIVLVDHNHSNSGTIKLAPESS
jgi:hypothetical protein